MNTVMRVTIISLVLALACLVGWRAVVTGMAHLYATDDPERALAWDPHQPAALIERAERQLAEHQPQAAARTARELLRREPLQAQAFRILGAAADAEHDTANARIFYTLAVRYAPRDSRGRSWIINDQLRAHRYSEAMTNIDIMLRTTGQSDQAFPVMAGLANTPEFARALAHTLSEAPVWRASMLDYLLVHGTDAAVNQVHAALQTRGGLSPEEAGRWVDRLLAEGRLGEAYSYWASGLALAPGASLPLIYNGGFESEPTGTGFDWRIPRTSGVLIERLADSGATSSFAMHLTFLGSRVAKINFEQRLLLAPGDYRLDFRARAQSLHSDAGLQWMISCEGKSQPVLTGTLIEGSFDWKKFEMKFTVPAVNCVSQRLYFHNPGSAAAGEAVSGDLWLDDMVISPQTP